MRSMICPGLMKIIKPWWNGEFSGNTYPRLIEALSKTMGEAELLVTWESGDSVDGIRVVDGNVTRHRIVQALGDEVAL